MNRSETHGKMANENPSPRRLFLSKFGESLRCQSASLSDYAPKLGSKTRQQGCSKIGAIRSELSSILHNFSTEKFPGIPQNIGSEIREQIAPNWEQVAHEFRA